MIKVRLLTEQKEEKKYLYDPNNDMYAEKNKITDFIIRNKELNLKRKIADEMMIKFVLPIYNEQTPEFKKKMNELFKYIKENNIGDVGFQVRQDMGDIVKLLSQEINYKITDRTLKYSYGVYYAYIFPILVYFAKRDTKYLDMLSPMAYAEFYMLLQAEGKFFYKIPELYSRIHNVRPNYILSKNVKYLNDIYSDITIKDLASVPILSQYEISEKLGEGAFGKVFGFKDINRTIKIFAATYANLNDELERFKQIEDDLFSGKGVITDMPYFESGKIGKSDYYYIIMPVITPIESTDWFKENQRFYEDFSLAIRSVAEDYIQSNLGYDQFEEMIILLARKRNLFGDYGVRIWEVFPYMEKMILAAYEAYNKFKGTDLHSGNVGFLEQRPDVFFYFDM